MNIFMPRWWGGDEKGGLEEGGFGEVTGPYLTEKKVSVHLVNFSASVYILFSNTLSLHFKANVLKYAFSPS